jgi:hypothetical protein
LKEIEVDQEKEKEEDDISCIDTDSRIGNDLKQLGVSQKELDNKCLEFFHGINGAPIQFA